MKVVFWTLKYSMLLISIQRWIWNGLLGEVAWESAQSAWGLERLSERLSPHGEGRIRSSSLLDYLEDSGPPLWSLDAACVVDGHLSFPDASASKHDGRSHQQHYGPGSCAEPVPAAEPVPVLQWGDECEQCGHWAAGGPDRRATGTMHPGQGPASSWLKGVSFYRDENSRIHISLLCMSISWLFTPILLCYFYLL